MNDLCPDCGRMKAHSVEDVSKGFCPKWWAIRDSDAEEDCKRYATQQGNEIKEVNEMVGEHVGYCVYCGRHHDLRVACLAYARRGMENPAMASKFKAWLTKIFGKHIRG